MEWITESKAKIVGIFGSFSGALGALGASWAVCHNVCMALVAILAGFGITVGILPLMFLNQYSTPLLVLGGISLATSGYVWWRARQRCSTNG